MPRFPDDSEAKRDFLVSLYFFLLLATAQHPNPPIRMPITIPIEPAISAQMNFCFLYHGSGFWLAIEAGTMSESEFGEVEILELEVDG